MILTVDIGNSNIKIGAWDQEELVFVARLQTNILRTDDEYAINLRSIFRLYDCNPTQFDGAIISSVVPPLTSTFQAAVRTVLQTRRVFLVSPGLKTGLHIKIENPAILGADIVSAGVAAIKQYPLPCVIVGLGTATTIFAFDSEGACLGGSIAPGVILSLEALSSGTAQLPHISFDEPGSVIGANSIDSMKSGTVYGTACMLDGMIRKMAAQLGSKPTVVAYGGVAEAITPHCEEDVIVNDNLVLEGLRLLYLKNTRTRL
jgi:type III pantothenate kinase